MNWNYLFSLSLILTSCQIDKTEYRTTPSWHLAMGTSLPKNKILDDGTLVIHEIIGGRNSAAVEEYLSGIEMESKDDLTGEITLRAVLPEHLLSQTLVCLRDRKWDILYSQILSRGAQDYFESIDSDLVYFKEYFNTHRLEFAKTMRKMIQSQSFGDTLVQKDDPYTTLYFAPNMLGNFKFKRLELITEDDYLKLNSIQ